MKQPIKINLEAGKKYAWCTCGESKNQPFCDGAHKSVPGGYTPQVFTHDKTEEKYLCVCKATKNAPFCDGSHKA
ncbi:MAG: CDGSH iron-sulfur domain-containing protein [Sediminibacterium sp.]|nr:CDGSH iron-sulfur domain-containing protein [Sediminibacterium sp.]